MDFDPVREATMADLGPRAWFVAIARIHQYKSACDSEQIAHVPLIDVVFEEVVNDVEGQR
jgi:hypothetical protein